MNGVDANVLTPVGAGFNTAMANLNVNVQFTSGIRMALTSYLSSRNHNETWVKDGYLLIDESPWDVPMLNWVMEHGTLKVGHFEINCGDARFRRTAGGNSLYNPFVGNLVMGGLGLVILAVVVVACAELPVFRERQSLGLHEMVITR